MKKATLATGAAATLPRQSSVWQIAVDRVRRSKRGSALVATTETYPRANSS
ncbi:hypothetical protein ACLB1E_27495 [Escherichia coli]